MDFVHPRFVDLCQVHLVSPENNTFYLKTSYCTSAHLQVKY